MLPVSNTGGVRCKFITFPIVVTDLKDSPKNIEISCIIFFVL